jgi:hypothetical protein
MSKFNIEDIKKRFQLPPNMKLAQICQNGEVVWEDPIEMFKVKTNGIIEDELKDSELKDAKELLSKFMMKE